MSGGSGAGGIQKIGRRRGFGRLMRRLEDSFGKKELPLLHVTILARLQVDTDDNGRGWIARDRLARFCRRDAGACVDAIRQIAHVAPALLYFVDPGRHEKLPWKDANDPPVGAIGVWIPDVALAWKEADAHRRCAESIQAHRSDHGTHKVVGADLDVFVARALMIDLDAPTESPIAEDGEEASPGRSRGRAPAV